MLRSLGIIALGLGFVLVALVPEASARKVATTKRNGVKLKCFSDTLTCDIKNKTGIKKKCKWRVKYVYKKAGVKRTQTSGGSIKLKPNRKKVLRFDIRRRGVFKRFKMLWLSCKTKGGDPFWRRPPR